jgi:phosphomethylpyrimidine synthase
MCGEHFCSMKASHEIREMSANLEKKAKQFQENGSEIYV